MKSQYKPGAKWRVRRNDHGGPLTFVVVGPSRPGYKICRVEFDVQTDRYVNFEAEYSHKHLKKYAVYQCT